jgi:endoglucanase
MKELLGRLLDAPGPSGYESAAAAVWREEAGTFAERVWQDVSGNAFAEIGGAGSPTVMLAGHLDEIGLIVHHIDTKGFLWVKPIGGWDPQVLVGQRVDILARDAAVPGVIGRRAVHLLSNEERDKPVKMKDVWIDIGAGSRDAAQKRVRIGDPAVIRSDTLELGDDAVAARSIDNRIGALVALEALRRAGEKGARARIVAVGTTQEEIGARTGGGARTSSYGLEPDAAIVIDVTHATDHPQVDAHEHGEIALGSGPVLGRGAAVNATLFEGLAETADRAGIPYQLQALPASTGTDADGIYMTRSGVATAVVSIPNRYMHTPNQLVDMGDVRHACELISTYLATLTNEGGFESG